MTAATPAPPAKPNSPRGTSSALLVGAGIFLSRILGLVRTRFLAGALGKSIAADAFNVSFRIPNLLQNLFGEGSLSASFVPVYARLLRDGEDEEAGRTAGAVFAALALVVSLIVLLGVLFTPQLTWLIAHGLYQPDKREELALTIRLTRILFPGAGLLVLSAWCLGILNSHRKFFLSYSAPVMWNIAMIAALIVYRHDSADRIAAIVAWASVAGSALQFLVQLPVVLSLVRHLRVNAEFKRPTVRVILRNFVPAFISKGVAQLSAFIDIAIASSLPEGMLGLIGYAQNLYMLPVSLFGMAVSASELAEMSHLDEGEADVHAASLRARLNAGLRRIAFLVIPSSMAFLALGGVLVGVLFENRRFTADATRMTWGIVAGSAVGLLANTMGRLYSSTFSALQDNRTPLNFALIRVTLTGALGWLFAILVPQWFNLDLTWGAAGLTASAGIAAWVEFTLLRRALNRRLGPTGAPPGFIVRLWLCALVAAAAAWGAKIALAGLGPLMGGVLIIAVYGTMYFGVTLALGIPESKAIVGRVLKRFA